MSDKGLCPDADRLYPVAPDGERRELHAGYIVAADPGANDTWNPYAIVPITQVRRWEAIEALARELVRVAQEPGLCKERCAAIMEARRLGLVKSG